MATVPRYGQRRVGTTALPGARKTQAETFESLGGRIGEAIAGVGTQGLRVGLTGYAEIQQAERERADDVAQLTVTRGFNDLTTSLLNDPTNGVLTKRGKAVLESRDEALARFDEEAGRIGSAMTTERQRAYFESQKAARRNAVKDRIDTYGTAQLNEYEAAEVNATLSSAVNTAILDAYDPVHPEVGLARVGEQLATITDVIDRHGGRVGMGPAARTELRTKLQSQIHEGVIGEFLRNQKEPGARQYFEEVRDSGQMTADAVARVADKLKVAGIERQAIEAADQVYAQHAPDSDDEPLPVDVMEAAIRERFTDKDTRDAAIGELRSRLVGVNAGRAQRLDARDSAVWESVLEGASLDQVRRMPEFIAMPGKVQVGIRDYFRQEADRLENRAYTRAQRELAEDARNERVLERDGWSTYWELSDPAKLSTMSRADILRQLPTLGRDHVNRLLTDQEQYTRTQAAVRNATIDTELFKDVAYQAGLAYVYATPGDQTDDQKANLGQLRAFVEAEIGRRQQGANRALTYEEKRTLMESLVDEKVMLRDSGRFWFDVSVPAAIVRDAGVDRAYVPFGEIPPAATAEALNYLRGINPRKTDNELRRDYRERIERAYALTLLRRPRAEVEDVLKGAR